jgi:uncharacterized Zn finger protein
MMSTKCADCEKGPQGQAGHENLYSHAFFGGEVVMKCRKCGTFWSRHANGRDGFVWSEANASDGSLLPSGND